MAPRHATVSRDTLETRITVSVDLDGSGRGEFATGVPFLEHMLDQIARHGLIDLSVKAEGDLHIDDHHTVEDIGITFDDQRRFSSVFVAGSWMMPRLPVKRPRCAVATISPNGDTRFCRGMAPYSKFAHELSTRRPGAGRDP